MIDNRNGSDSSRIAGVVSDSKQVCLPEVLLCWFEENDDKEGCGDDGGRPGVHERDRERPHRRRQSPCPCRGSSQVSLGPVVVFVCLFVCLFVCEDLDTWVWVVIMIMVL